MNVFCSSEVKVISVINIKSISTIFHVMARKIFYYLTGHMAPSHADSIARFQVMQDQL